MNEILVVIPWLPSGAQGRELEYAVAGWRRHFKEPHRIVVVGEGVTGKVPAGIEVIESHRVAPIEGMWRQHLDYVSCFRKVRHYHPDTDGFIFVADDCYAVNDACEIFLRDELAGSVSLLLHILLQSRELVHDRRVERYLDVLISGVHVYERCDVNLSVRSVYHSQDGLYLSGGYLIQRLSVGLDFSGNVKDVSLDVHGLAVAAVLGYRQRVTAVEPEIERRILVERKHALDELGVTAGLALVAGDVDHGAGVGIYDYDDF